MINGNLKKIMHDNGKQSTSRIFRHFLVHNHIKDKQIPNSYPQLQGKIEAYNKTVKNGFLARVGNQECNLSMYYVIATVKKPYR